jgi:molecular chaperone DnaJ
MQAEQRDYYEVLGIPKDADAKVIKNAFRKLAMQYHPDRNKDSGAEERFKQIAAAYGVLSDPKKRAQYDARGFEGVADFSSEDLFSGIDFGDIFGDFGHSVDFGGGLFDRLFGHRRRGPTAGRDMEVRLTVPLDLICRGGEKTIHYPRTEFCSRCQGGGAEPGTSPRACETCHGSGNKVVSKYQGNMQFQQIASCPDCHGRGVFIDKPCKSCQGAGKQEETQALKVKIPVGIEEGTALRIPRHGMPSQDAGGAPGDLLVRVYSQPDPRFQRRGSDLWREITVEIAEAVLGSKIRVATLDGEVKVDLPAGTQPETVLRIRGKGLPEFSRESHGDLKLLIHIQIPETLSVEERQLYEKLRGLHGKP